MLIKFLKFEIHVHWGVEVADVVKALALVVCIAPVGVRVPVVAVTKMDIRKTPCTECAPMVQNRTLVEDQLIKAELRLYEKKRKKKKRPFRGKSVLDFYLS